MRVVGVMSLFFYFCLPGIVGAFSPLILRTVIPLDRIDVQLPTAIALLLMVVSVLAGILIRLGPPKRISAKKEGKLARQMAIRYRPGALFLVSFLFFCIGLVGVYVELHAAGGWFSVIERGGSAYLEAELRKPQESGLFWYLHPHRRNRDDAQRVAEPGSSLHPPLANRFGHTVGLHWSHFHAHHAPLEHDAVARCPRHT